jgi:PGM1 C-terminal domain
MPHVSEEVTFDAISFCNKGRLCPPVGSMEETEAFCGLQANFAAQYEAVFPDKLAPKTVVIIPSLTLDQEILGKVNGHVFYEERLLCLLMLLRMPRTQVVYVSSVPIDPCIIDYYLHLLPGVTGYHARQRLSLLSCYDSSAKSLTEKILSRPRLMARIQQSIPPGHLAHIACFNVTDYEKTLAVRLGLPIYGCDPSLWYWGSKSGSRQLFKQGNIPVPPGFENLKNEAEVAQALTALKLQNPALQKAVVKINEGFSGEGNAVFSYQGLAVDANLQEQMQALLPQRLKIVASNLSYDLFMQKFTAMEGVVEEFVEGGIKTSPSVQCRINPLGRVDVISTHDQVLGGESGQVFIGADFPADIAYAAELGQMGKAIGELMKQRGVLGRFGIDFISVLRGDTWQHYAIEINLRKGGTTHPFLMLQFLTNGEYHADTGRYTMHDGQERFYFATDNLQSDHYKGLTPHDLIDIAMYHGLHYNGTSEEGVMFHLIGALSQFGKLGMVCVGKTMERARAFYRQTIEVLDRECGD